jgi:hypothetical protein
VRRGPRELCSEESFEKFIDRCEEGFEDFVAKKFIDTCEEDFVTKIAFGTIKYTYKGKNV